MAWFAAITPYLTAASAAMQAGQAYNQGQTAKKIAEYNAQVDQNEAKAANDQAARDEEAQRRESSALLGKQRAAIAESGLSFGGTTGMLADQSAVMANLDALNIRYGGTLKGAGLLSQAAQSRLSGRQAAKAGGMLAGAELLAGASNTYKQYSLNRG